MAMSIAVPFTQCGNRRGFTRFQLEDDPLCWAFYKRFEHCFERDYLMDIWLLIESDEQVDDHAQQSQA